MYGDNIMAKGQHLKRLRSEKAKVKLKAKTKHLPKGLNVTDTSFKAKKILIRGQLQQRDETDILSTRKLSISVTELLLYNTLIAMHCKIMF